tara:strand:- start:20101 stop:21087 length:987 start_codon:yes stop_codon:yes gene_type:complete
MKRKTFFGNQTLTAALEDRTAVYETHKQNLVHRVDNLPEDKVLIIPERTLALPPGFYSQQNWMKRGKSVQLPRHLRNPQTGPTRIRNKVYQDATIDDYVSGYEWRTTDNQKRKKVLLVDCLEAARIFYFANEIREGIKVSKGYWSKKESPQHGRTFAVEIPSRTTDEKYIFKFVGVPTENNEHQLSAWRNIETEGHTGGVKKGNRHTGCEQKFWGEVTFGRAELIDHFCPHEIAAYMAITQKEHKRQGRVILQPFALPSAQAVGFYKKLRERIFVEEERKTKKGLRQIRRRTLTKPEKELLLGRYTISEAKKGKNVFYARNLLKHHEW